MEMKVQHAQSVISVQLVDNGSSSYQSPRSSNLRNWPYCSKPIVKDGEIVAAPVLALSLSFDHRQIDGATGQNAMNHIKRLLNNPELLLMEG